MLQRRIKRAGAALACHASRSLLLIEPALGSSFEDYKLAIQDRSTYACKLEPADVKRLRQLEQENAKLKKLEVVAKKMVSAPARRRQVAFVCERGPSTRRACALMSVARSTLRYESRLVKRDAPALAVMRELAAQYPRYGYRHIQVFLARF